MKHYITLYSKKSSGDLENKVKQFIKDRDAGMISVSSDVLFIDYSREWLRTYKKVRERGIQIMYENIIEKHFNELEYVKISDIKRTHFQLVINYAAEMPRTCQQIAITFKQIIKSAISDGLLPITAFDMICNNIDIPKYTPSEKRGLTPDEKNAIQNADFTNKEKISF